MITMRWIRFAIGLAAIVLFIIFAVQNAEVASITFFANQFEASLFLILLLAFLLGAIAGSFLTITALLKRSEKRSKEENNTNHAS